VPSLFSDPRALRRAGLALASLILAWIGSGTLAALGLTRRWTGPEPEPTPVDFEALRLATRDGLAIGAFHAEPRDARLAIVLVHGNGSSRSQLLDEARALHDLGYAVMPITVRAHGDSEGTRNDFGYGARHDVIAAVTELERRAPGRPIVVLGISLGSAAALFAAEELDRRVAGYVLVGPYASLELATVRRTERYLPPLIDDVAFGALWVGGRLVLPELDRIAPCQAATRMPSDLPVLVIAGERDARAPVEDARCIARTLRRARIVVLPGDHEEVSGCVGEPSGLAAIGPFLDRVARGTSLSE
jgi:pimeloyl-ACP methyl ester carboxylesterase